jgi:hypothetical protein
MVLLGFQSETGIIVTSLIRKLMLHLYAIAWQIVPLDQRCHDWVTWDAPYTCMDHQTEDFMESDLFATKRFPLDSPLLAFSSSNASKQNIRHKTVESVCHFPPLFSGIRHLVHGVDTTPIPMPFHR